MGKIEAGVSFDPIDKVELQAGTNNNTIEFEFPLISYKEEQKTSKK